MDIRSLNDIAPPAHRAAVKGGSGIEPYVVAPKSTFTSTAVERPGATPSLDQVHHAVEEINKAMQAQEQDLVFSVDQDSNRTIVKVVDQQTQEVIRQMPSPEALEIAKALDKMQGLLIRQKA
jgi:flagellar protein FlaG